MQRVLAIINGILSYSFSHDFNSSDDLFRRIGLFLSNMSSHPRAAEVNLESASLHVEILQLSIHVSRTVQDDDALLALARRAGVVLEVR